MVSETESQTLSSKELQVRDLYATLRKLLSAGRIVITPEWNYLVDDWVTCVAAADIDDDGDIEIVAGSRDGFVRALTRQGTERWKTFIGFWVTAIALIPSPLAQDLGEDQTGQLALTGSLAQSSNQFQPRIILSTRHGRVCALNRYGSLLPWEQYAEQTPQVIPQLTVHPGHPNEVVVGGEDHILRLLDTATGRELGTYDLRWPIHGVCVADVDGDNEAEILAVSADKAIHILRRVALADGSLEFQERGTIKLAYHSYALAVAEQDTAPFHPLQNPPLAGKRAAIILSSDNGKDLRGWTLARTAREQPKDQLAFTKIKLPRAPQSHALHSRILTIHTADVNNDGLLETLVGSTDHFLSIFDQQGQLLWRQDFGQNIYGIYACDYDEDGIIEIIVGLGDNNIRACKIELGPTPTLYLDILQTIGKLRRLGVKELLPSGDALTELANTLGLLRDEEARQIKGEFAIARLQLELRNYETALSIFSRLKKQRVQHYWDEPLSKLGHIRDLAFGNMKGNLIDEIIVGNDEGELIALDINREKKELWEPRLQTHSSVISLSTNNPHTRKGYAITLVVLENCEIRSINNDGRAIPLPSELLSGPEEGVTSLFVKTAEAGEIHQVEYIVLGLKNQHICLYNALQKQRQALIPVAAQITRLYAGEILCPHQLDILAATSAHRVVLYMPAEGQAGQYMERWHFQAQDRIHALCVADIDQDGKAEIIIGSEDRNVYVLNHLGELKWRYFMPDGVLCVDVCDIDHDERQESEILVGVGDGLVYILDCRGDLLLQIPVGDRVRVIRAKDLHPQNPTNSQERDLQDNTVEIAVATDERLILFQYLPLDKIKEQIDRCWLFIRNNAEIRDLLYAYSDYQKQPDEHVRAFALSRLAGQEWEHSAEDFKCLRTAIARDSSLLVSQELANAIVDLCRTSRNEHDIRQSRLLLQQLARKPHREIRIAIVNMLGELAKDNKKLSFEYLKRFLRNEDPWLRRIVVRQLYHLVSLDPEQVFSMLMTSAHDKDLWIRQETGRSLACYFDYRHCHAFDQHAPSELDEDFAPYEGQTFLQDLHGLLSSGIDVSITKQMAISSQEPAVKQLFTAYARFQAAISTRLEKNPLDTSLESLQQEAKFKMFLEQKKSYQDDLQTFIAALQSSMQIMPQVEDILVIYQELLNVLQVTKIEDIEQLRRKTESEEMYAFSHFKEIDATLVSMLTVVDEVKRYRKREALRDQAAALLESINLLIQIRHQYIESQPGQSASLLPEDALFRIALQQWYALLQQGLRKLSGAALISIELLSHEVLYDEVVELSFKLTNTGQSAADAVRISIPNDARHYEVIGPASYTLSEVSTLRERTMSFTLKPLVRHFRLLTQVLYNDAEKHDNVHQQGHSIDLKPPPSLFEEIVNPYHGGIPISDARMFYGRKEDLLSLSKALGSTVANRIILLIGQRRSGKTSLIYQLESWLQPHVAVRIDLQSLALSKNEAELFFSLVLKIHEALLARGFASQFPNEVEFQSHPVRALTEHLKLSTQQLEGHRLILLFDEVEIFTELMQQKRLDENFLHYLRSLMQHTQGVNFLLAGAPRILLFYQNHRSALLNITQQHHLSRLKEEEALALITDPVHNLTYDPLALEFMHQLTGDQPYLIHLLCEELIYHCNKQRKNYANTNDIRKIIDEVLERSDNYFRLIWNLASSPEERLILALLAGESGREQHDILSLADLKEAFSDLDCPYDTRKVRRALDNLKLEEIIDEDNGGQLFNIPILLTRIWIRSHTTPDRIARDEFTTGGE